MKIGLAPGGGGVSRIQPWETVTSNPGQHGCARVYPPDIFIHPEIKGIRMMEFTANEQVLEQSQPATDEMIEKLKALQTG